MWNNEKPRRGGVAGIALQAALLLAASGDEPSLEVLKSRLRDEVARDPMDAMFRFALGAAWLFYQAEREENPRITSYVDALAYISTSMSVGYHEIHPRTQAGQVIASVVHLVGPSLAAGALGKFARDTDAADSDSADRDAAIVSRLDAILEELRATRSARSATANDALSGSSVLSSQLPTPPQGEE
ncbi:MAG: two pore domain potassium channel family protein [Deltaproteobacteria bacterium]|nr:two pore domain potassium channel family protein [Deltaproteobacteria bacterium]